MHFKIAHAGREFELATYSAEDAIARRMRKYGTFYERDLLDYSLTLLASLPDDGLIVDIGANFGNHSVFWSALSGREVVAIEANPELKPLLNENLSRNAVSSYHVVAGGAGQAAGLGRMRLSSRAPDQYGLAGVEPDLNLSPTEEGVFEIHTVPQWLERLHLETRPVRLLKIDVEGAEIPVLRGAWPILSRDRPEIFVEAATDAERTALDEELDAYGYRRVMRFCSTPTWHYSTLSNIWRRMRLQQQGTAARLRWRLQRLQHSVTSRLRPAA